MGAKQPVYDGITRTGSTLQTRCPLDDKPALQALLVDLKNKWNTVCGKSVDRFVALCFSVFMCSKTFVYFVALSFYVWMCT